MDQLSRRDAVYQQIDQISSALRPSGGSRQESSSSMRNSHSDNHPAGIATSPTSPVSPTFPGQSSSQLGSRPVSPSRSLSGGPLEYLNRVSSSLAGALQNSPLNGAPDDVSPRINPNRISSLYTSLGPLLPPHAQARPRSPLSPSQLPPPRESEEDLLPHQLDSVHGIQSAAQSTESLPDYSRGSLPTAQSVKYLHTISSPSHKIELTLESVGPKEYPVYIQDVCPVVTGKMRMYVQGDENLHEVRIRVKGVATTTVLRTQHNSSRAIAEEEEFWYAGCTLWDAQSDDKKATSQLYVDLPFTIPIPPMVSPSPRRKAYPMPPSFILATTRSYDTGGIDSASIRYYVKITLARKGLLRPNDRLFAPIVYYTRARDLSFLSEPRRLALLQGTPIPSPLQDPDAWLGRSEEIAFKKGFFSGKKVNYKIAILLPAPLIYGKTEELPYYIRITSSDAALLNKLSATSVVVQLIQRCVVISHGAPGLQESVIAYGVSTLADDGPSDGSDSVRRYKGTLDLSKAPATSFRSYNIEVSYHVACRLSNASSPVDGATQVPITLVSIPPVSRPGEQGGSRASQAITQPDDGDLPPSYFEVVERETPR
ncbi:hypothetical protein P389DRAFT_22380 [Cystobasidium minutum MCA 4210]|uniref:uncharacterized protein n=1 Tax=Cystobasidium minutum MCA 4210 TaxID=1397322 RepID=UPI0034CDCC32|eukprot:jgi/Rhomi1/22380/CE22379_569